MAHNGGMKIDDNATVWAGQPLAPGVPLLLVMHGYGANERDLAPLVPLLPEEFAAACIRAPLVIPDFPAGFAWFPIGGNPSGPTLDAANSATSAVAEWLDTVVGGAGTRQVVLLGFSQGGAMVTHLMRHYPDRFAAGVVLSGFIVPGEIDTDDALTGVRPPVFFGYDPMDPIVPGAAFARTREFGEVHFRLTSKAYQVGHGINEAEIVDVAEFLRGVLTQSAG